MLTATGNHIALPKRNAARTVKRSARTRAAHCLQKLRSSAVISIVTIVATLALFPPHLAKAEPGNAARAGKKTIKIGTGGASGIYFVAGNSICRLVRISSQKTPSSPIRCAAPPSAGSLDNLRRLASGELDFAIVQSDWQHHAYRGTSLFKGKEQKNLRSVFSLHVEPFQIVVGAETDIENWSDLAGKRVNIGNVGSGHRATFDTLLDFLGDTAPRFKQTLELDSSNQARALCDERIDAFSFIVGVPNASIAAATDGCEGRIINLQTSAVKTLVERSKVYRWSTIPKDTYFTTRDDITTFGVVATLVTRADVPDESVEQIVSSVFMNLPRLRALHPAFAPLMPRVMATSGLTAPLHPAAKRRLEEMGLLD